MVVRSTFWKIANIAIISQSYYFHSTELLQLYRQLMVVATMCTHLTCPFCAILHLRQRTTLGRHCTLNRCHHSPQSHNVDTNAKHHPQSVQIATDLPKGMSKLSPITAKLFPVTSLVCHVIQSKTPFVHVGQVVLVHILYHIQI